MGNSLWEALYLPLPAVLDYLQPGQFPDIHSVPPFPAAVSQPFADRFPHFQEAAYESYYYEEDECRFHSG